MIKATHEMRFPISILLWGKNSTWTAQVNLSSHSKTLSYPVKIRHSKEIITVRLFFFPIVLHQNHDVQIKLENNNDAVGVEPVTFSLKRS